ncbi:MAG: c-type cytochrome, partial [Deltaproteobacteria bacterium]|nr:c-type cytochrome [Deltaproteobacteria bacterium]
MSLPMRSWRLFACLAAMPLGRAHAASDPHVGPTTADGASLYAQYCALCHGAEREGHAADHAPSLRAPEMFESAPPAFRGVLDDSELDAVTAFLRSRAGGWAAPAPVVVNPPDPSSAVQNAKSPVAKLPVRQGRFVAAADVAAALAAKRRIVLLDARPLSDWQRGHLPDALPVPYYEGVERIVPHLPDDETPIVVY